jgi:hypothetical protein
VHPSLLRLAKAVLRKHFLKHWLNVEHVREVGIPLNELTLFAICDVEQADILRRDVELLQFRFITTFAVATRKVDQDGVCLLWSTWPGRT